MMIRRDILDTVGGFKPYLAEDFELTLRLYLAGYKILYREDISVPAECPGRLVHLIRQNLRWSQGVTSAFRQHFLPILKSPLLSRLEKLDLFLFGTIHLQAILFVMANILSLAILLAYILAPFQAYGALKGLSTEHGFWHRTPKIGVITSRCEDKVTLLKLCRLRVS